jgi:hypothetical protein
MEGMVDGMAEGKNSGDNGQRVKVTMEDVGSAIRRHSCCLGRSHATYIAVVETPDGEVWEDLAGGEGTVDVVLPLMVKLI